MTDDCKKFDLGSSAGIEIPISDMDDAEMYVKLFQKTISS